MGSDAAARRGAAAGAANASVVQLHRSAWTLRRPRLPESLTARALPRRWAEFLQPPGTANHVEKLADISNVQYFGDVELGSPGQKLTVIFDTGSSDLWVPRTKYDPGRSSTLGCPGSGCNKEVTIQYSVGSVQGKILVDRLDIAGCVIPEFSFVLAEKTTDLEDRYFDGVLGLGFPYLSHTGSKVLSDLSQQAGVNVFSFLLEDEAGESWLVFGPPPVEWISPGSLVYADLALQAWWTFEGALSVGGTVVAEKTYLALDTGTSFIAVPSPYHEAIIRMLLPVEQLDSCTQYTPMNTLLCPCSSISAAETVYITVGGLDFPIYPRDLFTPMGSPFGGDGDQYWCILEIQASSDALPFILGDTFLRGVAAVFDIGKPQVGLAPRPGRNATAQVPRAGPILPPHRPSYSSALSLDALACGIIIVVGLVLGYLGGHLMGCALDAWQRRRRKAAAPAPPGDDGDGVPYVCFASACGCLAPKRACPK